MTPSALAHLAGELESLSDGVVAGRGASPLTPSGLPGWLPQISEQLSLMEPRGQGEL